MISYTLIVLYTLFGSPNELIITGFITKLDCQVKVVALSSALRQQKADVTFAICKKSIIASESK